MEVDLTRPATEPAPRFSGRLCDRRSYCSADTRDKSCARKAILVLERAGARLRPGWPAGFDIQALVDTFTFHLRALRFSVLTPDQQAPQIKASAANPNAMPLPGMTPSAIWQRQNLQRLAFRAIWQSDFNEVDVFLSPASFTAAFPHDQNEPREQRNLHISRASELYGPAELDCARIACRLPATVAPVGVTTDGLPVGIKIMGPFCEGATPIQFAELLSQETGGFTPALGYD
jgi:amidase